MTEINYERLNKEIDDSTKFDVIDWFTGHLDPEFETRRNAIIATWGEKVKNAEALEDEEATHTRIKHHLGTIWPTITKLIEDLQLHYGETIFDKFPLGEATPNADPLSALRGKVAEPSTEPAKETPPSPLGDELKNVELAPAELEIPNADEVVKTEGDNAFKAEHWDRWKSKVQAETTELRTLISSLQTQLADTVKEKARLETSVQGSNITESAEYARMFGNDLDRLGEIFDQKGRAAGLSEEQLNAISRAESPTLLINDLVSDDVLGSELVALMLQARDLQKKGNQWVQEQSNNIEQFQTKQHAESKAEQERKRLDKVASAERAIINLESSPAYGILFKTRGNPEWDAMIEKLQSDAATAFFHSGDEEVMDLILKGLHMPNIHQWWAQDRNELQKVRQELDSLRMLQPDYQPRDPIPSTEVKDDSPRGKDYITKAASRFR